MMRYFSNSDVRRYLDLGLLIEEIHRSFLAHAEGGLPGPVRMDSYVPGGEFHIKGGHAAGRFAVKANSAFFGNTAVVPAIQGLLILFSSEDGRPLMVAQSGVLTSLRTAAASAVAARLLAADDSRRLGLIGAGQQACQHARAMSLVRPIEEIVVWSRDPRRAESSATALAQCLGVEARAALDPADAARSDIVVTATPSMHPLLDTHDVEEGTFVAAVGADSPTKQELSAALTARSFLVVDVADQCRQVGEFHHAVQGGMRGPDDHDGELGTLLADQRRPLVRDRPIIFDSTGTGFEDVAALGALLECVPANAGIALDDTDEADVSAG